MPWLSPGEEVDFQVVAEHVDGFATVKFSSRTRLGEKSGDPAKLLDSTPGASGMTTLVGTVLGKPMRPLKLNGTAPGGDEVVSGQYLLSRDAFLTTRETARPAVSDWGNFFQSVEEAELLKKNGAAPAAGNLHRMSK